MVGCHFSTATYYFATVVCVFISVHVHNPPVSGKLGGMSCIHFFAYVQGIYIYIYIHVYVYVYIYIYIDVWYKLATPTFKLSAGCRKFCRAADSSSDRLCRKCSTRIGTNTFMLPKSRLLQIPWMKYHTLLFVALFHPDLAAKYKEVLQIPQDVSYHLRSNQLRFAYATGKPLMGYLRNKPQSRSDQNG